MMGVAAAIQLMPITCGLHLICLDTTVLPSVVETIANLAYLALSLVGGPCRPGPQGLAQPVECVSDAGSDTAGLEHPAKCQICPTSIGTT
jgi:hypothetical protein